MDRDTAVARMKQGLGFRSDLTTECIAALQEARRLLERGRTLPLFLRQESQSLVLVAGSAEVAWPTDFIREADDEGPWYVGADGQVVNVEKGPFAVWTARFVQDDPGPPIAYSVRKATFAFFPARDVQYTLTWSYYKKSVDLSSNVSNNEWLVDAPEALIGKAGMILAADLGPDGKLALEKFTKMYAEAWGTNEAEDILRDAENQPIIMGSRV